MWQANDPRWLVPAGAFTLLVVGLLVWLHVFGEIYVEGENHDVTYAGIIYTDEVPDSVSNDHSVADSALPEHLKFPRGDDGELLVQHGGADSTCQGEIDGDVVDFPCKDGWVTITLWDQKMAKCTHTSCKAGMAFWDVEHKRCTIMLPSTTEDSLPMAAFQAGSSASIPKDLGALALAHEWVHCLRGSAGHVTTHIVGPLSSVPSGHLMHPSTLESGWRTEGL